MTTKEKPEFCAGVKILIERMQTNPEDFGENDYDLGNMRLRRETRFGQLAKMLDQMLTNQDKAKLLEGWIEWRYLSKEEQAALLEAYKQMRRVQFDKRIMERVFDENFYARQEEAEMEERLMKQRMHQQQLQAVQQSQRVAIQPFQTIVTDNTNSGGLMNSLGLGGIFK